MTAPSTPDLAVRILAAIDKTERAERGRVRLWEPQPQPCPVCHQAVIGDPFVCRTEQIPGGGVAMRFEPCLCPLTYEQWAAVLHPQPCPDETVLRHCAADQRTVERHSRPGRTEARGTQDGMVVLQWCECCRALMPCPDLLDRAAAYDITVVAP